MELFQLEAERDAFMSEICSPSTRWEVREWIRKTFEMQHEGKLNAAKEEGKRKRLQRRRTSTFSMASFTDSGSPGGFSPFAESPTASALQAVGGSIAASRSSPKSGAKSVHSADSLEVNYGNDEDPLTRKERVKALLSGSAPELVQHVNEHVARQMEVIRKRVDRDVATKFLRQAQQRRVFDSRVNLLRWQNARHQLLQKELDDNMISWILEAVDSWDQLTAAEARKEINQTDLLFDFLTKRAAHIDSGKLPTEIPMFKTMHASYSLPSMWKTKYPPAT